MARRQSTLTRGSAIAELGNGSEVIGDSAAQHDKRTDQRNRDECDYQDILHQRLTCSSLHQLHSVAVELRDLSQNHAASTERPALCE